MMDVADSLPNGGDDAGDVGTPTALCHLPSAVIMNMCRRFNWID